jgi:hypothetical protein
MLAGAETRPCGNCFKFVYSEFISIQRDSLKDVFTIEQTSAPYYPGTSN